ncbi:MAG: DUF5677 domain-containing protein [Coriobacteriia bacterium]|nr:DUF5677 domain-containing protein [Coriobacteriia bacterium]MCL2870012.1 DUF5677 domain-containing protein [Coriobacteriia bacterium]
MQIDDYLSVLHAECHSSASELQFNKTHPWHFFLVALYGSILELTGCILILAKNNGNAGLGAVLRVQLEAYIDLANLAEDPSYLEYIRAANLDRQKRIYSKAAAGNTFICEIAKSPDFTDIQDSTIQQLSVLTEKGVKPLSVIEKFKRANVEEVYDGVYRKLCFDTHNSESALISRHLEPLDEENFRVVYNKPVSEADLLAYLGSSAGLLVNATEYVYAALECTVPAPLRTHLDKLDEVHKLYSSTENETSESFKSA